MSLWLDSPLIVSYAPLLSNVMCVSVGNWAPSKNVETQRTKLQAHRSRREYLSQLYDLQIGEVLLAYITFPNSIAPVRMKESEMNDQTIIKEVEDAYLVFYHVACDAGRPANKKCPLSEMLMTCP